MINRPTVRIQERCPGCMHWGRRHVIDIATKVDVCTPKLVTDSNLEKIISDAQRTDVGRVCSWRECSEIYRPRQSNSFVATVKRVFGKRTKEGERHCPMCGKKIKPSDFGTFCTLECGMKFMDEKEKDERKADNKLE